MDSWSSAQLPWAHSDKNTETETGSLAQVLAANHTSDYFMRSFPFMYSLIPSSIQSTVVVNHLEVELDRQMNVVTLLVSY